MTTTTNTTKQPEKTAKEYMEEIRAKTARIRWEQASTFGPGKDAADAAGNGDT